MLFTFLVAVSAPHALSLRPASSSRSANFAKLRDLAKVARDSASKGATSLQEVADIVNTIMLQEGNATEHLDDDDVLLLNQVIDMISSRFYASMTSDHDSDEAKLAAAIDAINQCYVDFAGRIGNGGDLAAIEVSVRGYQTTLNLLQDDVDEKTIANSTAWSNLQTHMTLISPAPTCPAFPDPRTMTSLDVYFESSAYVTWWTSQAAAYWPVRDAWAEAHRQLGLALTAYAVGLAERDVAYCDWKRELEAACAQFSACYEAAKAHYLNVVKPAVEEDMKMRIEAFKAGETIIHQIKFLLAEEANQATPAINTDVYQIAFPAVPAKLDCDMSALNDGSWVPTPDCYGNHMLLDGCSTSGSVFSAWGIPREERADQRAGEAVCCNSAGTCTRRISSNSGEFSGFSHDNCITPDGGRLDDGVDTPSWTWLEARDHCEAAGLRLPINQQEMDTSCGTGCHKDFVVAWTA